MPGIFGRIRYRLVAGEGFTKYLRYALGEIVIITAGILIALQINNWNEERVEQAQIHAYARNLVGDLKADMEMIDTVHEQIGRLIQNADALTDYARGRTLDELDNLRLRIYTRRTGYRPFTWSRIALEQLKASGALRQIRNQELAKKIAAYEAFTYHLDEDYEHDIEQGDEAAMLAAAVVDANYADQELVFMLPTGDADADRAHLDQRVAEATGPDSELTLITEDINDVRRMINVIIDLRSHLTAREKSEIPRLKRMGEELIELLDEAYPPPS